MADERTVLVVDDEPDIVETLEFALQRRGFRVRRALDGNDAIEVARQDPPDIMLLDVMLPGVNGYEVSRQLKNWMQDEPGVDFPILLVTARRVNSPEREEFVSTWSRADSVIYKPFALDHLLDEIERLAGEPAEA